MYIVIQYFNEQSCFLTNLIDDVKFVKSKPYALYLATEYAVDIRNSLVIKVPDDYYEALKWFKEHNIPNAFVE